ncbi:hypothetical protein CROQUDRAFT_358973 [Cronartium quercuum f. sp. fusiforme G11]|uniref:Uncharacterized protein n=1 Tax=Cronartium quercuum f. sp. fusiforme G11 TaxID=708437 RepID=A0A9P6T6C0_9BASI|nr:hypothetical protein CROQUDRAFT_358973 [Cronartium quercuum f. sp. fusiforme G11]
MCKALDTTEGARIELSARPFHRGLAPTKAWWAFSKLFRLIISITIPSLCFIENQMASILYRGLSGRDIC